MIVQGLGHEGQAACAESPDNAEMNCGVATPSERGDEAGVSGFLSHL